jgi:hypothetical protein
LSKFVGRKCLDQDVESLLRHQASDSQHVGTKIGFGGGAREVFRLHTVRDDLRRSAYRLELFEIAHDEGGAGRNRVGVTQHPAETRAQRCGALKDVVRVERELARTCEYERSP